MTGNSKVLAALNANIVAERTGIHSYLLKAEVCHNLGLNGLAAHYEKQAREEMKHLHELLERVLFLEGEPDMASAMPGVLFLMEVSQMLRDDKDLEMTAITGYNAGIEAAIEAKDNGTRALFEANLKDEEGHLDWIENQLSLINLIGEKEFLQKQV